MKSIVAQWVRGKIPIVNGVVECGGRMHLFRPVDPPRVLPFDLELVGERDLVDLELVEWTSALPVEEVREKDSGLVAIVGECGMGSDGFLAVQENHRPESLLWLAFFDFSNPFESVLIDHSVIRAFNNLDEEWRFSKSAPWRVGIRSPSP